MNTLSSLVGSGVWNQPYSSESWTDYRIGGSWWSLMVASQVELRPYIWRQGWTPESFSLMLMSIWQWLPHPGGALETLTWWTLGGETRKVQHTESRHLAKDLGVKRWGPYLALSIENADCQTYTLTWASSFYCSGFKEETLSVDSQ